MAKFNIDRIRQIIGEINSALAKLQVVGKFMEKEFESVEKPFQHSHPEL